jgi:ABC-type transport system involved in multi-copper enzyme maturation permease subunit
MSTSIAITTSSSVALHARFSGILRGEFLKIARLFWMLLILLTVGFVIGFWLGATSPDAKLNLQHAPQLFLYSSMEMNLQLFRILSGILLLVLTSITIGREYQYGTIRILLARGVGRLQLLFAKLTMLLLIGAFLLVVFTLFTALLTCLEILVLDGNLSTLHALTPSFWPNIGIDLLAIFINMIATILLATAMNALSRSLAIGLSASLIWFPIDNVAVLIMDTLQRVTHSGIWSNATAYFLGPLLNRLPDWLVPASGQSGDQSFGILPQVPVDAAHALWVIGTYSLVFLVLALISTEQRDVKE